MICSPEVSNRNILKKEKNMHSAIKQRDGFLDITLPQIFPTMTEPDRVEVLQWYVTEGAIVRRGKRLLEVATCYGNIDIPMPPFLKGSYRIHQIAKQQQDGMVLGDLLVVLQKVEPTTIELSVPRSKRTKRNAA
jgi:hypothetical protein